MKKAKAHLRWFLNFLSIDIDNLSRGDFFKLLADMGSTLYDPFLTQVGSGEFPFAHTPDMRREIKECQQYLKKILDSLLGIGTGPYDLSTIKSFEDWGRISGILRDTRGAVIATVKVTSKVLRVENRAFMVPASIQDTMLIQFMDALTAFTLDDIKKCEREDCGKYFLEATKRRKRYCSDRCAWVVNSRKRRKTGTKKTKGRGGIKK